MKLILDNNIQMLKKQTNLFYLSTLISTTGSLLLTLGLITLLPLNGYPLVLASTLIFITRIIPGIISIAFPDIANKHNPKSIIVFTEIAASIFSFLLLATYKFNPTNHILFFICLFGRSVATSIQSSSRAKITKIFAGETLEKSIVSSSLFFLCTQGATVVTGIIGYSSMHFLSFETIVMIDALTFIIGGLLILKLQDIDNVKSNTKSQNIFVGAKVFFKLDRNLILVDIFIAIAMSGFWTFNKKLTSNFNDKTASLLLIIYGINVIITGYLSNRIKTYVVIPYYALSLALSFVLYPLSMNNLAGLLILTFVRDFSYWMILQYITGKIQHSITLHNTSVTSSFRTTQMIFILSLGEIASAKLNNNTGPEFLVRALCSLICFVSLKRYLGEK